MSQGVPNGTAAGRGIYGRIFSILRARKKTAWSAGRVHPITAMPLGRTQTMSLEKRQQKRMKMIVPLRVFLEEAATNGGECYFAHTVEIAETGAIGRAAQPAR